MKDLTEAVLENTAVLKGESTEELTSKFEIGSLFQDTIDSIDSDFSAYNDAINSLDREAYNDALALQDEAALHETNATNYGERVWGSLE
jgi:hypothetical protein